MITSYFNKYAFKILTNQRNSYIILKGSCQSLCTLRNICCIDELCRLHKQYPLSDTRVFPSVLILNNCRRSKYTKQKKSKAKDESSDDESEDENSLDDADKNAKIVTSYLSNMRADAVIKAGLGIARNKSEVLFYENKIRINGYKIPKKSHRVHMSDEVDVVKSSTHEGNRLTVSRVILTSAKEVEDRDELKCKFKVYKNLEIDNYTQDPYKSQQPTNM